MMDFLPMLKRSGKLPIWLIVLCSAIAAALLLPRQTPFPYRWQSGQPWSYHTLKAPFEFEVLYSEIQVQADVQRVNAEHAPYFQLNAEVSRQQQAKFVQLLEEQARISKHDAQFDDLNRNVSTYLQFGRQLLDHVFSKGIADPQEEFLKENPGFIYVASGKEERRVPIGDVWTLTTAHDFLTDTLPYSTLRQPEFLLPIIEKVLVPNLLYSDSLTLVSKRQKLAAVRSTGASVQKRDLVVERGEIVSAEISQKLDSLARRYDAPKGPEVLLGYALLALLAYGVFFAWLCMQHPRIVQSEKLLLTLPVLTLASIVMISFGNRVAAAVPLLIPLYAVPIFLKRVYDQAIGLATWAIIAFLTTLALDWGIGWAIIQLAGLAGMLAFYRDGQGWKTRCIAASLIAGLQIIAWAGAGFSDRLPDSAWTADTVLFLMMAAGISLVTFPLRHWWKARMVET